MIEQFTYRGRAINVEIDFNHDEPNWRVWYHDEDNLVNEYRIVGYPNVEGGKISVTYAYLLKRLPDSEVLKSYQDTYYEPNLEAFYRMKLPGNMEYGHFAGLQTVNGLLARLAVFGGNKENPGEGLRIFKADGSFYQPVTFDLDVVQPSYDETVLDPVYNGEIIITPMDGVPPFTYQLNKGAIQSNNYFSGLHAATHKVQVMDSLGNIRFRNITLENMPEQPAQF